MDEKEADKRILTSASEFHALIKRKDSASSGTGEEGCNASPLSPGHARMPDDHCGGTKSRFSTVSIQCIEF